MTNKITGPHSAIIDGKPTGLSGCATQACQRAPRCLRADPALAMRHFHECGNASRFFIPIVTSGAAACL